MHGLKEDGGGALLYLDGGDLLFRQPAIQGLPDEELLRERARLVARAVVVDGVAAVNVGRRDLAAGLAFLGELARDQRVPWVATNLRDGAGTYPFPRWRVVHWGGVSVAVLGVLPPEPAGDHRLDLRVDPPAEALRDALGQLPRVDAAICLSNLGLDAEKELASQVPGLAVVVGGGSSQILSSPYVAGDTVILHASDRGRYLGVLELSTRSILHWKQPRDLQQEAVLQARLGALRQQMERSGSADALQAEAERLEGARADLESRSAVFSNQIKVLDGRAGEDPKVRGWVQEFTSREATWRKREAPAVSPPRPATARADGYAGSASCRGCHVGAYQAWLATPHARSYADLKDSARDPQCRDCHASRLDRATGTTVEPVVSCEMCHGPGGRHEGQGNIARKPAEASCRRCHSGFHPDKVFQFSRAYEAIRCDRSRGRD